MRFFEEDKLFAKYDEAGKERIEQAVEDIMPIIERFEGKHSVGYFSGIWMDDLFYEDMSEDMRYDAACVALQRYKKEHNPEEYEQYMAIVAAGEAIAKGKDNSDDTTESASEDDEQ